MPEDWLWNWQNWSSVDRWAFKMGEKLAKIDGKLVGNWLKRIKCKTIWQKLLSRSQKSTDKLAKLSEIIKILIKIGFQCPKLVMNSTRYGQIQRKCKKLSKKMTKIGRKLVGSSQTKRLLRGDITKELELSKFGCRLPENWPKIG